MSFQGWSIGHLTNHFSEQDEMNLCVCTHSWPNKMGIFLFSGCKCKIFFLSLIINIQFLAFLIISREICINTCRAMSDRDF